MILKMVMSGLLVVFIFFVGLFVGYQAGEQIGEHDFCVHNLNGVFIYDDIKEQTDCVNKTLWAEMKAQKYDIDIGGFELQ